LGEEKGASAKKYIKAGRKIKKKKRGLKKKKRKRGETNPMLLTGEARVVEKIWWKKKANHVNLNSDGKIKNANGQTERRKSPG